MTTTQFKTALNSELRANDLGEHRIVKVNELGANTVLIFDVRKQGLNMKLLQWLNNRFQNGISISEENNSLVFINTPLQEKQIID